MKLYKKFGLFHIRVESEDRGKLLKRFVQLFVTLQVIFFILNHADLAIKESVVKVCRLDGIEPACQKKSSLVSHCNLIIRKIQHYS